jgi:transcriptional regulator with XRE-family HTH domain
VEPFEEMSFPSRLRLLRARKGVTIRQAARDIPMDRHVLASLERGEKEPTYPVLSRLAAYYGFDVGQLMTEEMLHPKDLVAKALPSLSPDEAAVVASAAERQHSAELAQDIEQKNKAAIRQADRVRKFLNLSRSMVEHMDRLMRMNLDTAMVESVAEIADILVVDGIEMYEDLNPDDDDSISEEVAIEQCEAAVNELITITVRMIEAQMAREKDEDKRDELRQRRQRTASRRAA